MEKAGSDQCARLSCMNIFRDHSGNITGGVEASCFFAGETWAPLSKDWQNLGAPPPKIGRIWVPHHISFFLITLLYVFYDLI